MNYDEDLTGTLVLVHPALADDPVNKQGQTGMLLYANTERDDIYVAFGKGEQALYSSDALLVFKNPNDIYRDLMTNTKEMPIADYKALLRINMLLDNGNSQDMKDAMKLVAENPGTISRAMITLQDKLGLDVSVNAAQTQEVTVSRGR